MADRKGYQDISIGIAGQEAKKQISLIGENYVYYLGAYLLAFVVAFIALQFMFGPDNPLDVFKGIMMGILSTFLPGYNVSYLMTEPGRWTASEAYQFYAINGLRKAFSTWKFIGSISFICGFVGPYGTAKWFKSIQKKQEELKHIDGTKEKSEKEIMDTIKQLNKEHPERRHIPSLPIGNVTLTQCNEVYGTLIMGAPGTGKTVMISQMLDELQKKQNYRVIAYTPKGDFISKYYHPERGDIIINPFDLRGIRLNIFDLIKNKTDYQRIASVLFPEQSGSQDPFWINAARACFAGFLNYCVISDKKTNADLWDVLCYTQEDVLAKVAPVYGCEEIKKYFSDSKLASNVSAVISAYTQIFKFLPKETDAFDMKAWLENRDKGGWIFVSNHDELSAVLKPWITLFIDFIVSAHLSLPDDFERRVVYVLDEVNTLHASVGSTIHKLAITGRSKGAVLFLGAQGKTGLEKTLGREQASDVYNAVRNSVFLAVGSDDTTANWMSAVLGKTMFWETEVSGTYKVGDDADGGSIRKVRKTEDLVISSVFTNKLKSLEAYVRLTEYGVCKTTFTPKNRPNIAEGFMERPDLDIYEMLKHIKELENATNGSTDGENGSADSFAAIFGKLV